MPGSLDQVIKSNQIIVFQISKKDYITKTLGITSAISKTQKNICYVTLNKPYESLIKSFDEKKIDTKDLMFIDGASGMMKSTGKVIFIQSPKSLTELSIDMVGLLKKVDSFVFDSLSTLLIYEDSMTAIKFVHSIVSKIRVSGKRCVFFALKEDSGTDMMKDINMFVDKVTSY